MGLQLHEAAWNLVWGVSARSQTATWTRCTTAATARRATSRAGAGRTAAGGSHRGSIPCRSGGVDSGSGQQRNHVVRR